jgi:hypothetical protein
MEKKTNDTARVYVESHKKKIQIDPKLQTADIDVTNNTWPKRSCEI